MAIGLFALPLVGLLVLAAVSLARLSGAGPPPEPAGFHVANVLSATTLLTLLVALSGPFVLLDPRGTTLPFALQAAAVVCVTTVVMARYLLLPVWQSAVWGVVLAAGAAVSWSLLLPLTGPQVEDVVGFLALTFTVWALVFLGLLALETLRHHRAPDGTLNALPAPDNRPDIRERTLRMGEMMLASPVLGLVALLLWT